MIEEKLAIRQGNRELQNLKYLLKNIGSSGEISFQQLNHPDQKNAFQVESGMKQSPFKRDTDLGIEEQSWIGSIFQSGIEDTSQKLKEFSSSMMKNSNLMQRYAKIVKEQQKEVRERRI